MAFSNFFHSLESTGFAQAVAHSHHLVGAALQIVHVVGLMLLLASVILLNLRALGAGLREQAAEAIVRETGRLLWIGLGLAAFSGGLIFVSAAVHYVTNPAFDWKVALLLIATTLQIVALHRLSPVPAGAAAPLAVRLLSGGAAVSWLAVSGAGRAIGYI